MVSDLSILAGRVRDFIAICTDESASEHNHNPDFRIHADAEFNGLALMLFTLQFNHNAAYRKICEARKISPNSVNHWTGIPAAPTAAFKELELTSLSPAQRIHVFHSSGTTGQIPSRHFHSAESLAVYEASALAWFRLHVPPAKHLIMLTPPPVQTPHSSLVHMFEIVRQEFHAPASSFLGRLASDNSWTLDFDGAVRALDEASQRYESIVILGTAFSFVHLLDHLAKKNLRFNLPRESRVMETGGYKNRSRILPKAELHRLIEDRLGVPPAQIICEYGMSELSSQAYDQSLDKSCFTFHVSRTFHFPPWARIQVLSPETGREVADGETGLLRIYDLANVFSVLAIQTEDLAIRRGDGFELLGRASESEPRGCSLMSLDSQIANRKS